MEVVEPVTNTISEGQEYLRNPKARLYAGQVICSKNYKDFTQKKDYSGKKPIEHLDRVNFISK